MKNILDLSFLQRVQTEEQPDRCSRCSSLVPCLSIMENAIFCNLVVSHSSPVDWIGCFILNNAPLYTIYSPHDNGKELVLAGNT